MASDELAAMALRMASGLPPRPACAVPDSAAPNVNVNVVVSKVTTVVMLFTVRMLHGPRHRVRIGIGAVSVFAEEELSAHVDVQDQAVVLVGRQLPLRVSRVRGVNATGRESARLGVERREAL